MEADTVIKDATIVTHDRTFRGSIAIRNGKISAIAENSGSLPHSDNVVDGSGKHLIPGLVDAHMHLNLYERNSKTESEASAAGELPRSFTSCWLRTGCFKTQKNS